MVNHKYVRILLVGSVRILSQKKKKKERKKNLKHNIFSLKIMKVPLIINNGKLTQKVNK